MKKNEAIKLIKKFLGKNRNVYTSCVHCSDSGMTRHISVYIPVREKDHDGKFFLQIQNITGLVANALGERRNRKTGGIVCAGCGYDAGHGIVYDLGYVLYPKGTRKPHGTRNGQPDKTGGYYLKHFNM